MVLICLIALAVFLSGCATTAKPESTATPKQCDEAVELVEWQYSKLIDEGETAPEEMCQDLFADFPDPINEDQYFSLDTLLGRACELLFTRSCYNYSRGRSSESSL